MTEAEAKAKLVDAVVSVARQRAQLHLAFLPDPHDDDETAQKRKHFLLAKLRKWAEDPILFIRENAWVADPRNSFGSKDIPEGLSPKGMVPLLPFKSLVDAIREVDRLYESGEECDVFIDKPRQIAATTGIFGWWLLHKWLFGNSFAFVLGSGKGPDEIDAGGKGKRDSTSLFGRLRMFLDAFMWNVSVANPDGTRSSLLRFNQHLRPVNTRKREAFLDWKRNLSGLGDSDDTKNHLVRPKWIVHGVEMFPSGEGNWIAGETPGPSFARSKTGTGAGIDEFPHCNENIGAGTDRSALQSCALNTRFRLFVGTWPEAPASTEMYRVIREKPITARIMHLDWTDFPFYLMGAHWDCPRCGHANGWDHTQTTGREGRMTTCSGCREDTLVTRFLLTSPWFRTACSKLAHNRSAIAREILNDPEGAAEDRLFTPWNGSTGVRAVALPDRSRLAMVEGFDPGTSALNPACWILAAVDLRKWTLHIVGYWMASDSFIEFWTPFIKRWSPEQMRRQRPLYGLRSENPRWEDAFQYPPEAIDMMARVSARRSPEEGGGLQFPLGMIGGDKYGEHRHMMESPYERLRSYGIDVYEEYTSDREGLVRKGVEWSSRVTIDPEIADIQPPGPLGKMPSLRQVFEGARAKPVTGQGVYKFDVDKIEPPNVSHAVDAFLYMVRLIENGVRAKATSAGEWEQEGAVRGSGEPWRYGGGEGGIGL